MDTLPTLPMDFMARGLLMLSPRLMPRLIPLFSIDLSDTLATPPTLPMVSVPMDTLPTLPMDFMARGLLMLSPRLMPRLIPLSFIDLSDTLATLPTLPMVSVPMDTLPTLTMDFMARGLLMLSLRLMPRLIPLFSTDLSDTLATPPTLPTVSVPMDTLPTLPMDFMARGLLMLSPRPMPRLIPLFSTALLDMVDTLPILPMDMLDTLPTLPTTMLPTDHSVPILTLDKKLL